MGVRSELGLWRARPPSPPPAAGAGVGEGDGEARRRWVAAWRIGAAWRAWSLGASGAGPYADTARALHHIGAARTPVEKGHAALAALECLAREASGRIEHAGGTPS